MHSGCSIQAQISTTVTRVLVPRDFYGSSPLVHASFCEVAVSGHFMLLIRVVLMFLFFFSPPRFFNPPRAVPNLKSANSRTLRAQVGQSDQPFRSKDRLKTHKHRPKKKANLLFFIAFSAFLLFFYGFYGFLLFLPHKKKHFLTFISF